MLLNNHCRRQRRGGRWSRPRFVTGYALQEVVVVEVEVEVGRGASWIAYVVMLSVWQLWSPPCLSRTQLEARATRAGLAGQLWQFAGQLWHVRVAQGSPEPHCKRLSRPPATGPPGRTSGPSAGASAKESWCVLGCLCWASFSLLTFTFSPLVLLPARSTSAPCLHHVCTPTF